MADARYSALCGRPRRLGEDVARQISSFCRDRPMVAEACLSQFRTAAILRAAAHDGAVALGGLPDLWLNSGARPYWVGGAY